MNVARTVVTTVSKSRSMQSDANTSSGRKGNSDDDKSFVRVSETMKTIFSLGEIDKEDQEGDQEFDMLMLDG